MTIKRRIEAILESSEDYYTDEQYCRKVYDDMFFFPHSSSLGAAWFKNWMTPEEKIEYFNDIVVPHIEKHGQPRVGSEEFGEMERQLRLMMNDKEHGEMMMKRWPHETRLDGTRADGSKA